jgi:[NiFe] hydrogenase diaphorase moiety large subunit
MTTTLNHGRGIHPTTTGQLTFGSVKPNAGLQLAVKKSRADIIGEISASGMKGRGGAGFPTGVKWNLAAAARDETKYVVCNADEGEPGTFKDRVILSEYADLVFEGMTIAALAVGAKNGIVYLRGEYSYLRPLLEAVLERRRGQNLLGENILGREGFTFDIAIRMGSGAYVCGEETALIESLEGHRGEPRNRPPFPVDTGYMGHPTIVNNVETLAWAACILAKGASWFKEIGTDKSTGLKLFSVSGDCERPGVYEFPMGISISELLREVGGEDAKAVQVGGASGHCVPATDFARVLAFEDIPTGGSIIVFGPERDMLAIAHNFLEFFVDESCGQCTPCRAGTVKLLEGVELLQDGDCSMKYLRELCALGETMQLASKCGLGQSSPNAFLSIVKHFQDEIMGRTDLAAAGKE